MGDPDTSEFVPATVGGLVAPAHSVDLVVERNALLTILVRDAESKEKLSLFNVTLERDQVVDGSLQRVLVRAATLHEEDGAWDVRVPRTDVVLFVEAPERRPFHGVVTIPAADGTYEVLVEMQR
jgi:hypothetical protein